MEKIKKILEKYSQNLLTIKKTLDIIKVIKKTLEKEEQYIMQWQITYSDDIGNNSTHTITLTAATFTEALVLFTVKYKDKIATNIIKI